MAPERRPNRVLGGVHSEFWERCARDELWLQGCGSCGRVVWPASDRCEHCDGDRLTWERMSGRGTIVSWCTFHQKYYATLPVPYDTVLVRLDEGAYFVSNPDGFGLDEAEPGMPVRVTFRECVDDAGTFRLPLFAPGAPEAPSA